MAGDWVTLPAFANGQIMRAKSMQDFANDMNLVKNPLYLEVPGPGIISSSWTFSSATWAQIDSAYYQTDFYSQGNPILAIAFVRVTHSASLGYSVFRFSIDGIAQGNSQGQFLNRDVVDVQQTHCFADILTPVAAGDHVLKLEVANVTAGNTEVWKSYPCLALQVFEL